MKTLQKYTSMAFLLISVATIVPAFANPIINEQETIKQEEIIVESQKTETVWYKRPEVHETAGTAVGITICVLYLAVGVRLVHSHLTGGNFHIKGQMHNRQ